MASISQSSRFQPRRSRGVGSMGPQSYAPSFPMQVTKTIEVSSMEDDPVFNFRAIAAEVHLTTGAKVTVYDIAGIPGKAILKIKGTSSQVENAQHLLPVTKGTEVSLRKAEDIIGIRANAAYVCHTTGANVTVSEIEGIPDKVTLKIKGTFAQVENAQHLVPVKHTMQVSFLKAGDIIGIGGDNAAAVRHATGVALSVSEIKGIPDKVAVEIKGTFAEVEMARHFVQGFIDCGTDFYKHLDGTKRLSYLRGRAIRRA